jgi:hypothetical protein
MYATSLDWTGVNVETVLAASVPTDEALREGRLEVGGLGSDCLGPRDRGRGCESDRPRPNVCNYRAAVADTPVGVEIERCLEGRRQPQCYLDRFAAENAREQTGGVAAVPGIFWAAESTLDDDCHAGRGG